MRSHRFLLALLLTVACTGEKPAQPAPSADPDAELRSARGRLAVLAQATANGRYDAEYRFRQAQTNTTGTVRIRQAPPQYRIDITSRGGASFFALTSGVVSCSTSVQKRSCFLVAKPGEEVPTLFDPGVQRLFRDAVEDLAAHPTDYRVERVAAPPSATPAAATGSPTATATASPSTSTSPSASPSRTSSLPLGECFTVTRVVATPDPSQPAGFEDGTYCFAELGVATSITVSSGSLTLVKLGPPPGPKAFKPPVKVQRLPDLSPTPKPSAPKKK